MAEDFKTGNAYVSPEDKAMGVYSSKNLPETIPTGIYAPQITEQQRLSDNFQSSELLKNAANDINNPSPLLYSAVDGTTPISESPLASFISTVNNPVGNVMQPVLDAATIEKKAPLTPAEEHVAMGQQVPATMQQPVQPVEQPPITQAAVSGIVNPYAGSDATFRIGIQQAEAAGVAKLAAESAYFEQKAKYEQEKADEQQKLQETFDFNYQNKMDDYNQSIKDFRALAGEKIVPGAFLARQDTQGSLMTGLAVALGGIGGALQGTNKNIGLEMIEKAIDKDVAAQQYNLDYKYKIGKANVDDQSSLLNKMREKFGDDKAAIIATKNAMITMVHDKMNAKLTSDGGSLSLANKAQATTALAALQQRREQYEAQLKASMAQQFEKQQMLKGLDLDNLTNEQALAIYQKDADKYVRGYGLATDPQLAKDFIQKVKPMGDTIRKLKSSMANIDNLNPLFPKDHAALKAIMADLQLTLKDEENYKLGVLAGLDLNILKEVTGDPTSLNPFVNFSTKAKLKETLKNVEEKMNNKIENYGFDPKKRKGNVDSLVKKD
jgi:hypothetical protein